MSLFFRFGLGKALWKLFHRFDHFAPTGRLWRANRADIWPLILLVCLPLLVALPKLLGWLHADPMLYFGGMSRNYVGGLFPGVPYLDPNDGLTTQALGYRAAVDWLSGKVPWWNPYSGVGLPLAAEYQPAVFFPLTLLLLLPQGIVWQHSALQMIAGLGTYGLLRQIGLGRVAALTGGLLYGFNGTLALFGHAPAFPVPFLPWMIWGVERAHVKAELGLRGGWRLFAIAFAMNLLAGFPETAFIDGLLVAAWAILRGTQTSSGRRSSYLARIASGGAIGAAICAPQILAFFQFLPEADIGGHSGLFGHETLTPWAALSTLAEPYAFWTWFGRQAGGLPVAVIFRTIGGYVTLGILISAVYEVARRRDALNWLLLGWIAFALAKTFGIEPIASIWQLVPGIAQTAFTRYGTPSWEFAIIVLAARTVDGLRSMPLNRFALVMAVAVTAIAVAAASLIYGEFLRTKPSGHLGMELFAAGSALWMAMVGLACLAMLMASPSRMRQVALAALLVADGLLMYAVPTLSNPRGGVIDTAAIRFLQDHLGFQRFYTFGPIQPNYAAYFGIGSVNYTYMPIPTQWVKWVQTRLDPYAYADQFNGEVPRKDDAPPIAEGFLEHIDGFKAAGVKYLVAPAGAGNPFVKSISTRTGDGERRSLLLRPGQAANGIFPAQLIDRTVDIAAIGVTIGNYRNTSDGSLSVTLCNALDCVSGVRNISESHDNAVFEIAFNRPLRIAPDALIQYTITHQGGNAPVVLWAFPVPDMKHQRQYLRGPAGNLIGFGLQIRLQPSSPVEAPRQVYEDDVLRIFELPDVRPYFSIVDGSCTLDAVERTRVLADCGSSSTLVRRELFFPGWSVSVGGKERPISENDGIFQEVRLPQGKSEIRFHYAPPHVVWAWLVMLLALAALCRELLMAQKPPHAVQPPALN